LFFPFDNSTFFSSTFIRFPFIETYHPIPFPPTQVFITYTISLPPLYQSSLLSSFPFCFYLQNVFILSLILCGRN
jgi:hypothetical protein